jgi:hypothetical protein
MNNNSNTNTNTDLNLSSEPNMEPNTKSNTEPNTEPNMDSIMNTDTDSDTDSDEYIDLSSCVENDLKHIFQFHLINEKLLIKHIGKSSDTPDIIIMENFGPESNMSLYNCVYSHEELESVKTTLLDNNDNPDKIPEENPDKIPDKNPEHHKLFFPIIKLIVRNDIENYTISSIVVKLNQEIVYEKEIELWELYWIENSSLNKEYIKTIKIEKNINPTNILENLIKLSIGV